MAIVADKSGANPVSQKLSSWNRTAANTAAVVALTPGYAGEIVRALDTGQQYMATGAAAGMWTLMSERGTF